MSWEICPYFYPVYIFTSAEVAVVQKPCLEKPYKIGHSILKAV